MKKKGYIRRARRKQLERSGGSYFEQVLPFMHAFSTHRYTILKFSATMAREVTKFIAAEDPIEDINSANSGDLELSNISDAAAN